MDTLIAATNLSKEQVCIVPGNHDVDRSAVTGGSISIINDLTNREKVNTFLKTDSDRILVFSKFHNYAKFVSQYFGDYIQCNENEYYYVKHLNISGNRIAVLCLNSAWASASHKEANGEYTDENYLLLGERQVRSAIESIGNASICIAALHHPLDWLREHDRDDTEPMLRQACNYILHGHLHRTSLSFGSVGKHVGH